MPFNEYVYDVGIQLARPLVQLATPFSQKLREGVAGRRGARDRFARWAAAHRDTERPLIWIHAPSVGESLMAQAIITEIRNIRPDVQIAFTYFSPSAVRVADGVGADVFDYMPWDTRRDMNAMVGALEPSAIAFVRTEIWPSLIRSAAARNVRTFLVNAVLAPNSSRLTGSARWLLQNAYRRLARPMARSM